MVNGGLQFPQYRCLNVEDFFFACDSGESWVYWVTLCTPQANSFSTTEYIFLLEMKQG
jgi:hypothetical protein